MRGLASLREAIRKFLRSSTTYEKAVEEFIRDLQRTLILADVNVKLVFQLSQKIRKQALEEKPPPGVLRRDWFIKIVYDCLSEFFGGDVVPEVDPKRIPYTMLLVGVQGSGKTTTAGKLALFYRSRGYRVGLLTTDTYRPAAYEQLYQLSKQVGAIFYRWPENLRDPIRIGVMGVKWLKEQGCQVIIIDTAGRHGYGEEQALLDEMKKLSEEIKPDEVVLVIDAAMGQKAFDLAKRFHETTPIGSIIVTKLDGTARGGGALSAVIATGAKIKFIGTGEKLDEFEIFNPRKFIARILGLGDIEGLIEKLKRIEEAVEIQKRAEAILLGKFTLRDLYHQIVSIRKMGPLSKILQMIPGFSLQLTIGDEEVKLSEKKMDKWIAILNSMTYEELDNPEIIDKQRMRRIALGAGVGVDEVKELIQHYQMLKKMLRKVRKYKDLSKIFRMIK